MRKKIGKIILVIIVFMMSTSSFAIRTDEDGPDRAISLVLKSEGLEFPSKEGGKTEYEIADMNHDGFLDIISVGDHGSPNVNSDQHGIMVWLGNGGSYWDVYQNGYFGYGGCAIGDLNLDGINDVAWGVHHDYASGDFGDSLIEAALGDGTGINWTSWDDGLATNGEDWGMFATDLADFDIDGDLDIISQSFGCCNGVQIYENLGNGSWSHVWEYDGGNVQYTLETGDFNADGYADFICSHWDVNVFIGDGNFSFINADNGLQTGSINAVDVADMNHDGSDDIVVAMGSSQGVKCYTFNDQLDQWESYSTGLPSTESYYLVQFGDIDGDEHIDIITYRENTGFIYLGNGNGLWSQDAIWTMPTPGDDSAMRLDGDVDFDGREDILIQAKESDFPFDRNCLRLYSPWQQPTDLNGYIKKPHGGESFFSNSISTIDWLSSVPSGLGMANVTILLSQQGSSGPWTTIAQDYPNTGSYQWLVQGINSTQCRIKIILNTETDSCSFVSDNDFSIINTDDTLSADANGPYYAEPMQMISFYGSASGGNSPYEWWWDFGDGNSSTEQYPQHAFLLNGSYNVTLTVTDNENTSVTDITYALIQDILSPPIADFSYTPMNPTNNDTILFIDNSSDADGLIVNWSWDFGDGNGSYYKNTSHLFSSPGVYLVCLMVTDDEGLSNSSCRQVSISDVNEIIDVNQTVFNRGFPIRHAIDGDWAGAQNFTPTLNTLTRAEIYLRKFGSPEFDLTVELRTDDPQGLILDSLVFTPAELPSSWTWLELDFTDVTITPGTDYFIVCPPTPSGVTTSFGYEWGYDFGNQYDGGSFWFTRDGGALWRSLPTMYEMVFKTYGTN